VCFLQDKRLREFAFPADQFDLQSSLHEAVQQVASVRSLCARCHDFLSAGNIQGLSDAVGVEFVRSGIQPTKVAPALLESGVGITVGAWRLAGYQLGSLSRGLTVWCEILRSFPKDAEQPSIVERDLGGGVYGCFSVFRLGLWIDNLVSRDRRKGHARRALLSVLSIADKYGATVYGKIEPNSAGGRVRIGAPIEVLKEWYRGEGFEAEVFAGVEMVKRLPRATG
jgi:hypothetical protein